MKKRILWLLSLALVVGAVSMTTVRCGKGAEYDASFNAMKF